MAAVLSIASLLLTAAILPFFIYLLMLCVGALWPRRARPGGTDTAPRFLLVIPAHDEALTIADTVAACGQLDYPQERYAVWLIADNCQDDTAGIARRAGARVLERCDLEHRSKGHALMYFFQHALGDPDLGGYDAAVIIDADTRVDAGLLQAFARQLGQGREWLQGYYRVGNPDASWRTRLLTLAFALFNGVWLLGQERLGMSVALRGNGMCFTLPALRRLPWSTHGLAEDLEFCWRLRVAGERAHFVPEAQVAGAMVGHGGTAARSQRLRWEAGRRQVRAEFSGEVLRSRLPPGRKLLYLIDLYSLPLARLSILFALAAALGVGAGLRGLWPVHGAMLLTLLAYLMSPFVAMGLPWHYGLSLLYAPVFVLWKFVLLFHKRPTRWVRTTRE